MMIKSKIPACPAGWKNQISLLHSKNNWLVIFILCILSLYSSSFAQKEETQLAATSEETKLKIAEQSALTESAPEGEAQNTTFSQEAKSEVAEQPEVETEEQIAKTESLVSSENVTLDFKEADIRNVLKIISYKSGVNIVTTPEVIGNVTIRLIDVPWQRALDVILHTYGFGYEKEGNIITVAPIEKLTVLKKQEVELAQVQPTVTEVFNLKYIDAQDAKKALEPQLSPRGKITVLEMSGQAGWAFGGEELGKRTRAKEQKMSRSKVLIISDIRPALDKMKEVIEQIDILPQQVLIETRILEVNRDRLKDIGFDWGIGREGAESSTISTTPLDKVRGDARMALGGHALGSQVSPAVFGPKASTISGVEPFNTGAQIVFQKLTGTQFEVILHAIEEDVDTNTLSAPRIMALNNQEASIIVGTRYPILKQDTTASSASATVTTVTLDYYQDIGIQLNVVPQISVNNHINMVVHPAVTSYTQTLGTSPALYPIIETREAETRVFMKDGETVVIGGLLKDVKSKGTTGIPFLSKIPILGILFRRDTIDTSKIDLLVFITARIVKEGEFPLDEEVAKLRGKSDRNTKAAVNKKKKK